MHLVKNHREILQFKNGRFTNVSDSIVTEFPVTVKINGEEFVTLVCTPEYIEDMVVGFLAAEGVIRQYEEIDNMWIQEKEGIVHIETSKINPFYQKLQGKRFITSCCGNSRQGFVFVNDAMTAKKMDEHYHVSVSVYDCFRFIEELENASVIFQETGGAHTAALCDDEGIVLSRTDIGRHNALDKIYGYCLKNNISVADKIIVFSGRISSEILLKVAKIGCEVILSKSAPTELALQLAEDLGITTIGFIRNESLNVYTHPGRIVGER
ncbi:formate dehydrogenase accessory sulfurtransferase FdhD [Bacillus salipaludis]|uniref:formate dehydrogenase accessory sulfurtransferase FdhD n=1 Tax=Bacillus salipaludis TaxID=2547811 RepID=UPI003D1CDDB1